MSSHAEQIVPQHLDNYLREWEERVARGEPVAVTDLGAESLEIQAALAQLIGLLQDCDRLLELENVTPASSTVTARTLDTPVMKVIAEEQPGLESFPVR